ncbi:ribosome silencing factor [Bacteroidia bacterium]|nr:ribosome silencing factor [Bacteroidia bacterium]MDB9883086.1 ribosome silencing factor [Bacteroidia bacterium]MDC1395563.1 ribosome silencing factor [Bacteroidia bacterium]
MAKDIKLANALAEVIVKGMQEKKAKNIVKIDLSKVNEAAADYFVICHGDSDRQVKAIGDSVEEETLKVLKEKPVSREGQGENRWVLLDYVNVVVHVFQKDVRSFYEIEELWHDGKFTTYEDMY